MTGSTPITEADLHAYVDGMLVGEDRTRVEQFLAQHPDAAVMVQDWQADSDSMRAAFAGHAQAREDDRLIVARAAGRTAAPRARRRLALAAAFAGVFAAGTLAGSYGPVLLTRPDIALTEQEILPKEAQNAFLVYASEVRHPVEVFAGEEAHLAAWLGKRLAIEHLKVPGLGALGFRLVGGRLLPVGGRPGAMFMYEDGTGNRITVLVGRNAENRTTGFRFATLDALETFYWIDGDLGYAVTGEIPRELLRRIAEECYRQFPS